MCLFNKFSTLLYLWKSEKNILNLPQLYAKYLLKYLIKCLIQKIKTEIIWQCFFFLYKIFPCKQSGRNTLTYPEMVNYLVKRGLCDLCWLYRAWWVLKVDKYSFRSFGCFQYPRSIRHPFCNIDLEQLIRSYISLPLISDIKFIMLDL